MSFKSISTLAILATIFAGTHLLAFENEEVENNLVPTIEELPGNPEFLEVSESDDLFTIDEASFDKGSKEKSGHKHGRHHHGHKHGHHDTFKKMAMLKFLMDEPMGHRGFGHGHSRMGFGHRSSWHGKFASAHGKMHGHSKKSHGKKDDKGHHGWSHHKKSSKGFGHKGHRGMHGFGHHELSAERAAIMGRTLILYSEIEFTKEQQEQFKELFKNHFANSRKTHGEMFKKIHGLMKAASEGKSEEEIKNMGTELGASIASAASNKTNLLTEARKILTEEQLKKIDETKVANDQDRAKAKEKMKAKFEKIKEKMKEHKKKKEEPKTEEKNA